MLDVETTKVERTGAGATGRAIAIVLIAAAIGLAVLYPFAHILHNRCLDLPSYYIAGKLALNGRNPYNPVELRMTAQALGMGSLVYPYIYFPMLALIFMPLSLVNYQLVQIGWFFLSQAFFWLSLVVIRSIGKTCYPADPVAPAIRWMSLIVMASLSYPLVSNFMNGQVNTIILFLLSAFVLQLIKGLNIQAGILLGLVSMIKPQPLILFPYLLFKRRYRAAGAALATFVIGTAATATVIGWSNFRYYLREVLPTFNMVQTTFPPILIYAPANQSIHGLVFRLLHSTEYSTGFVQWPHLIRPIATVLVALIFCASAWVIFRRQARLAGGKAALSTGAGAIPEVSPLSDESASSESAVGVEFAAGSVDFPGVRFSDRHFDPSVTDHMGSPSGHRDDCRGWSFVLQARPGFPASVRLAADRLLDRPDEPDETLRGSLDRRPDCRAGDFAQTVRIGRILGFAGR